MVDFVPILADMFRANQSRDFPNGSAIGEDGRAPEPPDPAYRQILKGVPAADFSADELIYLPRNLRSHRLYG